MKKLLPFYLGIKCFCKKISKFKFIIFLITISGNITTSQILIFFKKKFKFFIIFFYFLQNYKGESLGVGKILKKLQVVHGTKYL
jgi:hypothetical protein